MNLNNPGGHYGVGGGGSGAARNRSDTGRGPRGSGDFSDGAGSGDGEDGAGGSNGGPAGGGGDDNGSGHGGGDGGDLDQIMVGSDQMDELYVDAEDPDSVPNLLADIHRMLDYVRKKPLLLGGSASFMRDHLRTLLASNSAAADVAASMRDAHVTRVRAAMAGMRCSGDPPPGHAQPQPPRSPGSDQDMAVDVLGNGVGNGQDVAVAPAQPLTPRYGLQEGGGGANVDPVNAGNEDAADAAAMNDNDSVAAEPGVVSAVCSDATGTDGKSNGGGDAGSLFTTLPDALAQHVFSFLDGPELARMHGVCKRWRELSSDAHLWKALTLRHWRALEHDEHVWKFIDSTLEDGDDQKWRRIYPAVSTRARWTCRLQKTGKFICNLVAHHIAGAALGNDGLPSVLVVERRFNIHHLKNFVVPNASVLYFEPETDGDTAGFHDFIDYLIKRTRAGLALEEQPPQRRFIFIPPCEFSQELGYAGPSLLGVVQVAYPPINQ